MAERNFTTVLQRPDVPSYSDEELAESAHQKFSIETPHGHIEVCEIYWYREYRGSAEALCAYGLIRLEWLPGQPGNNKVNQAVLFTPEGPRLQFGRDHRGRNRFDHIVIARAAAKSFCVRQPYNESELVHAKARVDAYHRVGNLAKKLEPKRGPRFASLAAWKDDMVNLVGERINVFDWFFSGQAGQEEYGETTIRFDDESLQKIRVAFAAFAAAVNAARPIWDGDGRRQYYKRDANVIFLRRL